MGDKLISRLRLIGYGTVFVGALQIGEYVLLVGYCFLLAEALIQVSLSQQRSEVMEKVEEEHRDGQ
ncbi:MAG: hypothetical protein K8U57_38565 [Planctomycetes bacterium]|nr:hypothetical protein [Planctomycetota bacterium]